MYEQYRDKITGKHTESFPLYWIAGENILYLSTWIAAGWLVWPVRLYGWPIATSTWVVVVLVVQALLKRHVCSGCYYHGKSCHLGWGRLSACMFEQDSGDARRGVKLALFYLISPPFFLVAGLFAGIFLHVGRLHWVVLGFYTGANVLSFLLRKRGCMLCAMRLVCPGSAARIQDL